MQPGRIERIRQLFEEASALPKEQQAEFLARECSDEDMRREVEGLLNDTKAISKEFEQFADEAIRSPISAIKKEKDSSSTSGELDDEQADPEKAGEHIGPYQLVHLIGEGGFGTVWEAHQESPVKRVVAIKFLKMGMATREIIQRFESERQALAMMSHPNIAQVYDAGATPSGRPFFVMELVEGIPLTSFCDKYKLSLKERLHVFNLICEAIQHAHQKGVVHRDLKPNNILVRYEEADATSEPVMKIIDFGVAKVLRTTTSEQTMVTGLGQMIGTPAYMSPEQASFGTVVPDTRTDIYSLGILLYELLTGTLPHQSKDFNGKPILEVQKIIQTKDCQRPSSRLKNLQQSDPDRLKPILQNRRADFRLLYRAMHSDLDWVVVRCLEKDPDRRYSTAHGLFLDINRFLKNEPLIAGPPSATYRISKLVKRHRRTALATTFVLLSICIGLIGTIMGLIKATEATLAEAQQRQLAEERTQELELVTEFQQSAFERLVPEQIGAEIFKSMVESYDNLLGVEGIPDEERTSRVEDFRTNLYQLNPTDLARQTFNDVVLKRSSQAISEQFGGQPVIEAALRESLAQSFLHIGLINEASTEQKKVLELRDAIEGMDQRQLLETKLGLAKILFAGKSYSDATNILRNLLTDVQPEEFPDIIPEIRITLGQIEYVLQNYEVAENTLKQAHQEFLTNLGETHPSTLLAELESIQAMRHSHYDLKNRFALGEPEITKAQIPLLENFLDKVVPLLGEDHELVWKARLYYAEALCLSTNIVEEHRDKQSVLEKIQSATGQLDAIYTSQERILGAYHPTTLNTRRSIRYNTFLNVEKDPQVNRRILNTLESILDTELEIWGENHPNVVDTLIQLADFQVQFGLWNEGIPNKRKAISILKQIDPSPSTKLADLYLTLVSVIQSPEEGMIEAENMMEVVNSMPPDSIPQTKLRGYREYYILALRQIGKIQQALDLSYEWDMERSRFNIYLLQGRWDKIEELIQNRVNEIKKEFGTLRIYRNSGLYIGWSGFYWYIGKKKESTYWLKEAVACQQMVHEGDPQRIANLQWMANVHANIGELEEARKWAKIWEENKDYWMKNYSAGMYGHPAFPNQEGNPYYDQEAYHLFSIITWDSIGDREKTDAAFEGYFAHKEFLEARADPDLKKGYDLAIQGSFYHASYAAPFFTKRGYFEEAEWLFTRGLPHTYPSSNFPEKMRDFYNDLIHLYEEWHKADPTGGHLEKIPQWQEKIDAIDAEYAKWRTEESS